LLRFSAPTEQQRSLPCSCGHQARYHELRSRRVLTALGTVKITRPWYLCPHCHQGQFHADQQLDIQNTDFSPGVRRMQALVGQYASFDHGREQMALLAGLELTAKSVERVAESIGADIARRNQQIDCAVQLDLPIVIGEPVSILYVQMDGTGIPVVKRKPRAAKEKSTVYPHIRRRANSRCVFTQTGWDEQGLPFATASPPPIPALSRTPRTSASVSTVEAWKRGWSRAEKKIVIGDGAEWIWNIAKDHFSGAVQIVDLFHARQHLWDFARLIFSQRHQTPKSMDRSASETLAGQRQDRQTGRQPPFPPNHRSRAGQEDPQRRRLLCHQRGSYEVSHVPQTAPVR
jgi:hypothetical protein